MLNRDFLKEALYEIKQEELKSLPAENEIEYEFSKEFKASIKKLIKKQKKTYSSKTLKRAIIILVAAILAMIIAGSAVAEQNKFLDFLYRIRNDDVLFIFDNEKRVEETTTEDFEKCFYTLNYVPEGYEQTEFIKNEKFDDLYIHWEKPKDKKYIYFDQGTTVGTIGINTFGNYVEEIHINSVNIICAEQDDNFSCFWKEKGYYFKLHYPKELGKDFLIKNAGKLVELPE